MLRRYTWKASTTAGEPLSGSVEVHPGRVTDEARILNGAWDRAVYAARLAGADIRRLVRVSEDASTA